MPTTEELTQWREALLKQRGTGVARVRFADGRSVEYRGDQEIANAIADLDRRIDAAGSGKRLRQIRTYASKGL